MELTGLIIFASALVISAGSPGPSIAALVSRVLTRGWQDVAPFVAAMWIGEGIWLTCAIAGLAAIAEAYYWAFMVIKWCGVAYLLYLAVRMWRAPSNIHAEGDQPETGSPLEMFSAGMMVTLGNPKIMVFYLALLPTILDMTAITLVGWLELTAVMFLVLAAIDCSYILLAAKARGCLRHSDVVKKVNKICAGIMGGAAVAIANR